MSMINSIRQRFQNSQHDENTENNQQRQQLRTRKSEPLLQNQQQQPKRHALSNVTNTILSMSGSSSSNSSSNGGTSKPQTHARRTSHREVLREVINQVVLDNVDDSEEEIQQHSEVSEQRDPPSEESEEQEESDVFEEAEQEQPQQPQQSHVRGHQQLPVQPAYEWTDLDTEDLNDPYMVAEYSEEIYEYFHRLEIATLPASDYIERQSEITSNMRDQLVDWMNHVHLKFRLLPETLYIAINLVDRFLTRENVKITGLQLLGTASLFIASKYEEIYSPSVTNFSNESSISTDDILRAEKYILEILDFNLSYPNPMNFLRRISKADSYHLETRTLAKYFLEITIMDAHFIGLKPSLCAAAAMYLSRKIYDRGEWDGNLIHYSGEYFEDEILPVVHQILNYLVSPVRHEEFFKKYASRKCLKASVKSRDWAKSLMRANQSYEEGDDEEL